MRNWLIAGLLLFGFIGMSLTTAAQSPTFTDKEQNLNAFGFPQDETSFPVPVATSSFLLTPGTVLTSACPGAQPGGGILCGQQFAVNIPNGTTGLNFAAISQSGDEFVVFIRFNEEIAIEEGRAVTDLAVQSIGGIASFTLPNFQPGDEFPGIQPGRYFFALAHFETSNQNFLATGGTVTTRPLSFTNPAEFSCSVAELLCNQQHRLEVDEIRTLNLSVQAEGNFQLHVRFGEPVQLDPLTFDENGVAQFGNPISDFSASSENGTASVTIDGATVPPIQTGVYYVAVVNFENLNQNVVLNASQGDVTEVQRQPPMADFSFSPDEPRVGQTVTFTDTSTDGGTIVSRSWDFGDGNTSTDANPTHTYAAPGTYRVSLLVSNDADLSTTVAKTITVLPASSSEGVGSDPVIVGFVSLAFENPDIWERTVADGCVTYTNTADGDEVVQLEVMDGDVQNFTVAAGDSFLVCGNAAHFNSTGA